MQTLFAILRDWGWIVVLVISLLLAGDLAWGWKKKKFRVTNVVHTYVIIAAYGYLVWLVQNIPTTRLEIAVHAYCIYLMMTGISVIEVLSLWCRLRRKKFPYWKQVYYGMVLGILVLCICVGGIAGIFAISELKQIFKE